MKPPRVYKKGIPKTVICPFCQEEFRTSEMLFRPAAGGEAAPGRHTLLDRIMGKPPMPRTLGGRNGGANHWEKLCPKKMCSLPITAGRVSSLVIGIVGASQTGKTHYVTSLIEQLGTVVGERFMAGLVAVDDVTTKRFVNELKGPLFRDHRALGFTVGAPPPLIYNLTFKGSLWKEKTPRSVTLALYDTAGETMRTEAEIRALAAYLRVAAGVIFIVDPLQCESVRDTMPPDSDLPELNEESTPAHIIGRIQKVLEDQNILRSNQFATPIAFTMTKCDALLSSGRIESSDPWNSTRTHKRFFDRSIHERIETSMRRLFQSLEPQAYNNIQVMFPNHSFFGVSATGCSKDLRTNRYAKVSPWRVEDPLLWLLSQLNVIPTT